MSQVWTPVDRVVIHFGSAPDETFGSRDEKVVEQFVERHPEFVIPGRDE